MAAQSPDESLVARTAATYAATAEHFDDAPLSFWDRYGRRSVARLGLQPGASVLDACCGTGASAIPAAAQVGPGGRVLGVDLSEPALALARTKAEAAGLHNVAFRAVDIRSAELAAGSFDAVVCVFGIFFLPDMVAGLRDLWQLVRPGGRLALTVWGPGLFEPAASEFWRAVRAEQASPGGSDHEYRPWDRLTSPEAVAELFSAAG
ncbi:MAG TPA: class I SAM-dependent methyltransferase, partial [Actinomycetota bacterium]|nr:class I SAM-dependent methyltransferase [Actinomycetota bacterium]